MALNFRQFIYIAFLSLIVLFGVKQCSQQVLQPYFSKETVTESRVQYQKSQESRVKQNVESVLQKLLGKGTFDVSVSMMFSEDFVQKNVVQRDPQNASETVSEEVNNEFQRLRSDALNTRTPIDAISVVGSRVSKLPGMIDLKNDNVVKDEMPGFPVLPDSMDPVADTSKSSESKPVASNEASKDPNDKGSDTVKKKVEQSKVFFNETITQTTQPGNKVQRVVVNVIVDQDQVKALEISKEQLEKLISDVASISPSRGDVLNISYLPFIEKSYGLSQFYANNKKALAVLGMFFDKLGVVFIGLVLLGIVGAFFFWAYSLFRKKMQERALLEEQEKARRLEAEKVKEKEKADLADSKRKAVVSLAQSRPSDVATLILNWIEAFEGEENKKNGSAAE